MYVPCPRVGNLSYFMYTNHGLDHGTFVGFEDDFTVLNLMKTVCKEPYCLKKNIESQNQYNIYINTLIIYHK